MLGYCNTLNQRIFLKKKGYWIQPHDFRIIISGFKTTILFSLIFSPEIL
jgi:hypothetical protein